MPNKARDSMAKKFADIISNSPKTFLLFFVFCLTLSVFNLKNFKLDASSDSLVLEGDDDLKYYREVNEDYSSSDFLIIIFQPKADLFSDITISKVREMVDAFEKIDGVDSVLSYLDAPLLFSPKMGMSELADNLRTIEDKGSDKSLARLEFMNSPLYTELLTDSEAVYTAMQLTLKNNDRYDLAINKRYEVLEIIQSEQYDPFVHDALLDEVNEEIKKINAEDAVKRDTLIKNTRSLMTKFSDSGKLYLGGTAMIASDMISFIKSDLQYFALGVLLMFIVTLSVIFRKPRWVLMPLVSSALIAIFVIGFLGWMDWRVTVVSSNFISLLLIIFIPSTISESIEIENFKLDDSSLHIRYRLSSVGVRVINNVVDYTNYVLHDIGQPLHAFDRDKLYGTISVRFAKDNEILKTLDEQERNLSSNDLIITDDDKPIALAGVMGGYDTEVTNSTKNLLIESAYFDKVSIMKTSRRLNLISDASIRFERGIDFNLQQQGLQRFVNLFENDQDINYSAIADSSKNGISHDKISFQKSEIEQILGVELDDEFIKNTLFKLNIDSKISENKISFTSPSGSLAGSIGKVDPDGTIVQVTPLDGYLPTHYKFKSDKPIGFENLFFNGCKQTQATTIDGTPPVEVFTTNPNTLKVSDSGRGSGEPILEIE